jgi:hypothetical protein
MLQAKRPHENFFTEWCQTDNYEVIERNIKIIESYGWEWRLNGDQESIENEQILINQERVEKEQPLKDQLRSEIEREIFAEIEKIDADTVSFQEFYSRIMKLKKKNAE